MGNLYSSGGGSSSSRSGGLYSSSSGASSRYLRSDSQSGGSPSVFSWLMDKLSRGQYASANAFKTGVQGVHDIQSGNPEKPTDFFRPFGAFARGLAGKDKTNFSDVLQDSGVKNKYIRAGGGLVGDIFLDPTTYAGVGIGKIPGEIAKAKDAIQGVEEVSKATKAVQAARDAEHAVTFARQVEKVAPTVTKDVSRGRQVLQRIQDLHKTSSTVASGVHVAKTGEEFIKPGLTHSESIAQQVIKKGEDARKAEEAANAIRYGKDAGKPLAAAAPVGEEALKLTAMPGKVTKASKVGVSATEAAAHQPSLFADIIGKSTVATKAAEAIPKTAAAIKDTGAAVHTAADVAAPVRKTLQLKVLGKPIAESEKAYDLAAKVLRPVGQSAPAQLLSQSFRTAHHMLPEVHGLQRQFSGLGRQSVADEARATQEVFKGVTKQGQKDIYKAVQEDTVHLLPKELRTPGEWVQKRVSALNDMQEGARAFPGMEKATHKFEDIPKYLGGPAHDRAPQAYIAQYDKVVRKDAYKQFADTVAHRFPNSPEVRDSIKRSRDVFGVEGHTSGKWIHYVDNIMSHWKRWNTTYRPGFHLRNMLGDIFNAHLAGTTAERFKDAGRILAHGHGDAEAVKGGHIILGGKSFSLHDAEMLYRRGGLETSFIETEVAGGTQRGLGHALTEFGDKREKFTRMATFLDSMDRGLKKGLSEEKAIEEAATRVRKYHFDYTDLTPFERKIKHFIPFYTYNRKELPVLLEHTLTSPGKIIKPAKIGSALETMMGVQHDPHNPFPGIKGLLPEYMQNQQVIQRGGNKVFQPGMPTDMLSQLSPMEFIRQQAGNVTPMIKGPLELATGKSFPLGYSLQHKGQSRSEMLGRYAASYGPYGNLARDSKSPLSERMMNLITGAGSKTVNSTSKSSKSSKASTGGRRHSGGPRKHKTLYG